VIVYKSPEEVAKMRRAGRIVAGTIDRVLGAVRPNVTTAELDAVAEAYIHERGATPSFKGYRGFPASICTSLNDEIVHGIPSQKRSVAEGDLLKLDFGAIWEGFHADSAVTVFIGEPPSAEAEKLVLSPRRRSRPASRRSGRAGASPTSERPSSRSPSGPGSRSSASTWDTGSGAACTRSRRSPTTASPGGDPC
jgi:methionyl aminopeptidase